jgi:hypothetical protein
MAIREGSDQSFLYSGGLQHRMSRLNMAAAERLLDAEAPDLSLDLRHRFLDEAAGNPLALVELPAVSAGRRSARRHGCRLPIAWSAPS